MRAPIAIITLVLAAVAAEESQVRVPGVADFSQYPEVAALLRSPNLVTYTQNCAGSILNNRSVLTSARCTELDLQAPNRWRFRVGSAQAATGGIVYQASAILTNDFDEWSMLNDVAIIRSTTAITFGPLVQPGRFAGSNYFLADNQPVETVGWGYLSFPSWSPAQFSELRRVSQWTINLDACRPHYSSEGFYVQNSMICSGFSNPGGVGGDAVRDRCLGEPGAPLYHNGVVVGIRSYGLNCISNAAVPPVSTRVSSYINWISSNA